MKVIINPVAGAGTTAKKWPQIKYLLDSHGLRFEYDLTEAPGHARELAKSAAEKGYDLVVSVGGDGTINEVVNGLYDAGRIGEVTLGIISTGAGSDYIRTVGIPGHLKQACQCLRNRRKLVLDVGVAEYFRSGRRAKRLFVNSASLGLGAEVVKATTQRFKTLGRTVSYLMGYLTTFLSYKNRDVSVEVGGETKNEKVYTIVVSNGRYAGGGMLIAPDAELTDGLLNVMTIGDMSKLDLLLSLPRVYNGTHLTLPKVTVKRAKEAKISATKGTYLEADGELLGEAPAYLYVLPGALNVAI
jgi:YegS/Rv2252/BmrU family lipid kinase